MSYKIYHPSGSVTETESLRECLEKQAEGCTYEEIDEEFSPIHVFGEPKNDEVFDPEGLNQPAPYRIIGEAFPVDIDVLE